MKHAVVTGGSDGLGKQIALSLIKAGYKVTILSRDQERTGAVAKELNCDWVVADVSDYSAAQAALAQAEASQPIDILINNAGVWIQGLLEDSDPALMKRALEVNTLGPINCTRAVVSKMKDRRSGKLIYISSQGGFYAKSERAVYNATKFGLTGFIRSMHQELKSSNIAVIGMFPGALKDTGIFKKAGNDRDMSKGLDPAVVAEAVVYCCNLPDGLTVPEFGIESLSY